MASGSGSKDGKPPPPVAPKPKGPPVVPRTDNELKLKAMMGNWTLADRDLDEDEISQDPKLQAIFGKAKEIDFADDDDNPPAYDAIINDDATTDKFQDHLASRSVFEKAKGFQNVTTKKDEEVSEKRSKIDVGSERRVQDIAKGVLGNKSSDKDDKHQKEEFVTSRNVLETAKRMAQGESESDKMNRDEEKVEVKGSRSVLDRARDMLEGKYENEIVDREIEDRFDVKASRNVREVAKDADEGKLSNVAIVKTEVDGKASRNVVDVARDADEGKLSNVEIIKTEIDVKASRKVTDVAQDAEEGKLSNVTVERSVVDVKASASRKVTDVAQDADEGKLSNVTVTKSEVDAREYKNVIDAAKNFEEVKEHEKDLENEVGEFETSRNVKETAKSMLEGKFENEVEDGEVVNRIDVKASRNVMDVARDVEEGKLNNAEEMMIENRIDVKSSRNVKEVATEIDVEVEEWDEKVRSETYVKNVNLGGSIVEEENGDTLDEQDDTEVNQLISVQNTAGPINDDMPSREECDIFGRNAGHISNFGNMYFDSNEESEKHAPVMVMGFSNTAIIGHETFQRNDSNEALLPNPDIKTGYDALGPEQEREIAHIINNVLADSGRSLITEEKLRKVSEAEDRIPYIGLAIGLILGILVAVCDEIVPNTTSISIYFKIPFVCIFVLMGYGLGRLYKNILVTQREGLLDPPLDILGELNPPSEVNNAQNGNAPSGKSHGGPTAARKRYRKGKS